jgi:hypothetical protein
MALNFVPFSTRESSATKVKYFMKMEMFIKGKLANIKNMEVDN